MKKRLFIAILLIFNTFYFFGQIINDSQIIQNGHWIYDDFDSLALESGKLAITNNTPISAGELKVYFKIFDREKLSDSGKKIYDKVENFLYNDSNILKTKGAKLDLNILANPEVYYKANDEVDWTFNYYYKDNFLSLPLNFGISDYFSMGGDFFFGKNYDSAKDDKNFTNIPLNFDQIEFLWPRFAYGSLGYFGDDWGINLNIGRQGKTIGKTLTGSIIYNETFENDCYVELGIFNQNAKYTMNITQISHNKFMYWHQLDLILWNKFRLAGIEGALINNPFEFRFLVPTMVYHSYSFWRQYYDSDGVEGKYYNEGYCASYLGVTFEYTPVHYLKIYGLYAMNEIQLPNEAHGKWLSYPDSFGIQLGSELKLPSKYDGFWIATLEGVYTAPYLYIKQAPGWSLYRDRLDMITFNNIQSWLGSPFGPDTFAISAQFEFMKTDKWNLGLNYLFKIHGENNFSIFNQYTEVDSDGDGNPDTTISSYYPYTQYVLAEDNDDSAGMDAAIAKGRNMWMSGTSEFSHKISLFGSYDFTDHISLESQISYIFVFNNNNISDNFQQGLEFVLAFTYNLF